MRAIFSAWRPFEGVSPGVIARWMPLFKSVHEFIITQTQNHRFFLIAPGDVVGLTPAILAHIPGATPGDYNVKLFRQGYEVSSQICLRGAVSIGWLVPFDGPEPAWNPKPIPLKLHETTAVEPKVQVAIAKELNATHNMSATAEKFGVPLEYVRWLSGRIDHTLL